jgi:hypothetical protein
MSDQYVQILPDNTGKKVDTEEVFVGTNTVQRQRVQIAGNDGADLASVDALSGLAVSLQDIAQSLRWLLVGINRPMFINAANSRVRVDVENFSSNLSVCGTVTTVNQLAGFDAKLSLLNAVERSNWALNVRSRIT